MGISTMCNIVMTVIGNGPGIVCNIYTWAAPAGIFPGDWQTFGGPPKICEGVLHIFFRQALYIPGMGVILMPVESFFLGAPKSIKVDIQIL